jgi:hypothetical protein
VQSFISLPVQLSAGTDPHAYLPKMNKEEYLAFKKGAEKITQDISQLNQKLLLTKVSFSLFFLDPYSTEKFLNGSKFNDNDTVKIDTLEPIRFRARL